MALFSCIARLLFYVADRTLILYEDVCSLREEDAADLGGLYLNASFVVVPFLNGVAAGEVWCVDMHLSERVVTKADALITARAKSQGENNEY